MRTLIVIIVSLCIFNAFPQAFNTYPLNDGDFWQYELNGSPNYISWEVIGDTTMENNGTTYKIIQRNDGYNSYKRFFEDKVYTYNSYYEEETIEYDFTLQPGDTVLYVPRENDTILVTLVNIKFDNIFGSNRKQWVFLFDDIPYFDVKVWATITDSIGLTLSWNIFDTRELVGSIIKGITYGNITSIGNIQNDFIKSFTLFQNFPNPFNPNTKISYSIPKTSLVLLKIFNVLGQEVATLINEEKPSGNYEITWYAKNLPSGVYFYQLKAGEFIETRKMLLLK
jgi:hypothetical protein